MLIKFDMEHDADMNEIDADAEMLESDDNDDEDEQSSKDDGQKVYLPGKELDKDEELVCDESAYILLHQAHTGAPCLSFDVVEDKLGNNRETFPLTSYIVAGTQAARAHVNR